jgi:molybdenum cofactor cytidylyltransferase
VAGAVSAIVLAAGASARLGHPKAMIRVGGRPVLERVRDGVVGAGAGGGVIVVGPPHAGILQAALDPAPLEWVFHPEPGAGRTGSLQAGWREVPPGNVVLLWPVDRPLASVRTVRALLEAESPSGSLWVVRPVHADRPGHPVLLSPGLRERVLAAPRDAILRGILGADDVLRLDVPVEDAGIHADLDTDRDVRAAGGDL